ncbi:MAG: hypothetical protein LBR19_00210 [Bifidobacteriaceae bacterium]|jgi:hypothetical protein|nr:hypothetical protein [Bifidobacteriaceae bacterium]
MYSLQKLAGLAALAISCPLALAACTAQDEPDVASLPATATAAGNSQTGSANQGGQGANDTQSPQGPAASGGTTPDTSAVSQKARAEAMFSCLRQAGLTVDLEDVPGDQAQVTFTGDDMAVACAPAAGEGEAAECQFSGDLVNKESRNDLIDLSDLMEQAVDRATTTGAAVLMIGEQDHSEVYAACLAESGYIPPTHFIDPTEELRQKQREAEVSAEWAACARANGFPATQDPAPPVADGWATQPMAVLPHTITTEEFRALLQVCPSFDVEAHNAARDTQEDQDPLDGDVLQAADTMVIDPKIGFDLPGYDGSATEGDPEIDQVDLAHMQELNQVWIEVTQAAWAEWYGLDTVPTLMG